MVGKKSFELAVNIITIYKKLVADKKEFVLSKQILRSETPVGANIREALNGQSKRDFIHNLSISQKECDETIYWLELLFTTEYISKEEFEDVRNQASEILKIIRSIILTTKSKNL
ncbi:four helix bundle protein [Chryseobacterium sp. KMC2]|uniref:four helix bundle protein n=1 Tax=Chryseobacterium sp. KMC2 TaxID=2800705 RepID=UPI00293D8BD3|nr:four helix bundle protein [Chryseobacterium sp. KMC2]